MKTEIAMVALALAVLTAGAGESFRWMLNGTGKSRTYAVKGLPETGTYTVRFRAALMNARGGKLRVVADGVAFECYGDGFALEGSKENHVLPGQLDDVNLGFELRNRCYHEFVFVCTPEEIVLFGDSREKRPIRKLPGGARAFSVVADAVDLDVAGLESAACDMRGTWTCRNMIANGGFETLDNGYPTSWSTYNFGYGTVDAVADLKAMREMYCIDGTVAWEGRNSMRLKCGCPFWECWVSRPKDRDYVYSLYAKAAKPGTKLTLMVAAGERDPVQKTVEVGTDWQRFELAIPCAKKTGGMRCGMTLPSGGCVWVDGAQLEYGSKATAYVEHPFYAWEVPPDPPAVMDHYYSAQVKPKAASGRPPRMPRVDPKRNSFRMDGKEVFTFGFCVQGGWQGSCARNAVVYDRFKEWGFNMYDWISGYPKTSEEMVRTVEDAARRGLYLMFYVAFDLNRGTFDAHQVVLLKSVVHHPNVLGVNVFDEMFSRLPVEKRKEPIAWLRQQLGADVPIQFNEFDLGVINDMDYSLADVASADFYVIGRQEVSALYYALKQHRDQNPDAVVTFYPMGAGHYSIWPRDASPAEVLAQAYMGYVLEVFNVKWWTLAPMTGDVIPAMAQAKREMDLIDPSKFLDGESAEVTCKSRNDAVKFTARRMKSGVTRVIAVNIENRPNAAKWTLPSAPKAAKALVGKGPDKVSGATIEDAFGPLERRVYDFRLD